MTKLKRGMAAKNMREELYNDLEYKIKKPNRDKVAQKKEMAAKMI